MTNFSLLPLENFINLLSHMHICDSILCESQCLRSIYFGNLGLINVMQWGSLLRAFLLGIADRIKVNACYIMSRGGYQLIK